MSDTPFTATQAEEQKSYYLEKLVASQREVIEGMAAGLCKAEQQCEELLGALAQYGCHHTYCELTRKPASKSECSCGLREAIAKAGVK